ncbi:unnamed protein product [Leptidea sinapis]|uniref:UBC core domain-containing protein n=1 Tax=Leptidea sinapis TaxID=189913 RepID=A0A5E4R5H7_9NEOP|nr:unnamed protein product [Leptidea sinapis]
MAGQNPGSPTDFQYFYEDEVYKINNRGQVVFGLVLENFEASSSDPESDIETPIQKGEIRVVWHPSGTERVVSEKSVGLADRSLMPGDVVRRLIAGKDTQRGYCRDIEMTAALQIVGTKHVIQNVASERLQPLEEFTPDLAVCLESWVGTSKFPDLDSCALEDYSNRRRRATPYSSSEFYPGQVVFGPLAALDNANWLHMTKEMKAAKKHKMNDHKFTVESVTTESLSVHWQCRALCTNTADTAQPQPPKFLVEDRNSVRDGSIEMGIPSTQLYPIHHLDGQECFPGDFVINGAANLKHREYGVVQRVDHHGRTAIVNWYRTYTNAEEPIVYDLKDHPDFQYRPGTVVIRVANFTGEDANCTAGQVIDNFPTGRVKVWWVDGHTSMCWPQDLYKVGEYDSEDGDMWASDGTASEDSWETQSSAHDKEPHTPDDLPEDLGDQLRPNVAHYSVRVVEPTIPSPVASGAGPAVPRVLQPRVAAHIERGRVAMQRLEEIFAEHPALQSQEVMRKLLNLYKDCRFLDRGRQLSKETSPLEFGAGQYGALVVGLADQEKEELKKEQTNEDQPADKADEKDANPIESAPLATAEGDIETEPPPEVAEEEHVCVSLLGTWSGRGVEVWGKDSSLLQVIVSLQGLILNDEPYFNEAGYEKQKGTQQGKENSRMYNEMVLLKLVQSMTRMTQNPPEPFREEILQHLNATAAGLCRRLEGLVALSNGQQTDVQPPDYPLVPASRGFCLTLCSSLQSFRAALRRSNVPVPDSTL